MERSSKGAKDPARNTTTRHSLSLVRTGYGDGAGSPAVGTAFSGGPVGRRALWSMRRRSGWTMRGRCCAGIRSLFSAGAAGGWRWSFRRRSCIRHGTFRPLKWRTRHDLPSLSPGVRRGTDGRALPAASAASPVFQWPPGPCSTGGKSHVLWVYTAPERYFFPAAIFAAASARTGLSPKAA